MNYDVAISFAGEQRAEARAIGGTNYELLDRGILNVADWGWYDPRDGT